MKILFLLSLATFAIATPRHTILMICDGCGAAHLEAAGDFLEGHFPSSFQAFTIQTWMSTYSSNGNGYDPKAAANDATYVTLKPTDSAASATALSTGIKTYDAAIGVGPDQMPLQTIVEAASLSGKSTGVVTTVPFSHATPAAMAAHNISRSNYGQIAREMLQQSNLDVVIGGGHPSFDSNGVAVTQPLASAYEYVGGKPQWTALQLGTLTNVDHCAWTLIQSKSAFEDIAAGKVKTPQCLVGVLPVAETAQEKRNSAFGDASLEQAPYATPLLTTIPNLATTSLAALRVLDQNPQGSFLMIEGGATDWASHANRSARMVEEVSEFLVTVDSVSKWIGTHGGFENNLLIVTADHETGYLTNVVSTGKGHMPSMTWGIGAHTNQLVRLFARGLGAESILAHIEGTDPIKGEYTDNARIGQFLQSLIGQSWKLSSQTR